MKTIMNTTLLASMLLFSSHLSAACIKNNLAGTWHSYLHLVDPSAKSSPYLFRCTFVISRTGKIMASSKCDMPHVPSQTYIPLSIQGGLLSVEKTCKVSGKFTMIDIDIPIDDAWLNKDKSVLSGEGLTGDSWFTLHAIKQ